MAISSQDVAQLRQKTGAGMMAAKKALEESKGNMDAAIDLLRKKGETKAAERSGRETHEGVVASYVHQTNKLAALVSLRCETDFVARTPEFQALGKDIAMHVAASNPLYIQPSEIPSEVLDKEKEIIGAQLKNEGIPDKVRDKVLEGKLKKYYEEVCLLYQPFVKNPDQTIAEVITQATSKIGENIQVAKFVRVSI